jgi:enoyl-CoA hydratase/carnithine racemase
MEQITIGAIEGFCVGGGVALAVALDFRVMARDAHLRVPEIGLGMNMSWQSVPRMLHLIGPGPHQAGRNPGRPAHLGG